MLIVDNILPIFGLYIAKECGFCVVVLMCVHLNVVCFCVKTLGGLVQNGLLPSH